MHRSDWSTNMVVRQHIPIITHIPNIFIYKGSSCSLFQMSLRYRHVLHFNYVPQRHIYVTKIKPSTSCKKRIILWHLASYFYVTHSYATEHRCYDTALPPFMLNNCTPFLFCISARVVFSKKPVERKCFYFK